MVRATVGGRPLELTKDEVLRSMRGHRPEAVREHVVEMLGTIFPPKQVLATATGWPRQSFTTMEAVRVLSRLGFQCRRAVHRPDTVPATGTDRDVDAIRSLERRVSELQQSLTVLHEAVAALAGRISRLEASPRPAAHFPPTRTVTID